MSFSNWTDFFKTISFTYFRTSLIQERYIEKIKEYSNLLRIGKVSLLEIATGSGYTSVVLADLLRKNATIISSDLDPDIVEELSQKFTLPNLSFKVIDSFKIDLPDNSIDIIFHQGFLEHFDDNDIVALLKEQSRVAEYIIFDVPNDRRWNKTQEFGNERFLSHQKWQELAEQAGLIVVNDTARRLSNPWKSYVPHFIYNSEWFNKHFGESSIIVCKKDHLFHL
jgi:ubiquinone/menaquinone biosynthesis C-methylase UbiE